MALARVPLSHGSWVKLGVFRHGAMEEFEYARTVFNRHVSLAGLGDNDQATGKKVLEIGPGESLYTAVLAKAIGFSGSTLVDVARFALPDVDDYKAFARWLEPQKSKPIDLASCATMAEILARLDSKYLTEGLVSLQSVPDQSIDLVFSHAVLEHVRKDEFEPMMIEVRRILRPDGVSTHQIDFRDHLQESLNSLRFSDKFWESKFVSSSGFYTNRFRYHEVLEIFSNVGFQVEVVSTTTWEHMPLARGALSARFRDMPDEAMRVSGALVRLS